jgi:hypothetical protein
MNPKPENAPTLSQIGAKRTKPLAILPPCPKGPNSWIAEIIGDRRKLQNDVAEGQNRRQS